MRKPVGLVALNSDAFMVVCNDGSLWQFKTDKWTPMLPVPGTKADPDVEKTKHKKEKASVAAA